MRLGNPESGECVSVLKGHTEPVNGVAFSPDGDRLASAGWDATLRLWKEGKEEQVLKGHTGFVREIVFTPDGKHLYSAGKEGE